MVFRRSKSVFKPQQNEFTTIKLPSHDHSRSDAHLARLNNNEHPVFPTIKNKYQNDKSFTRSSFFTDCFNRKNKTTITNERLPFIKLNLSANDEEKISTRAKMNHNLMPKVENSMRNSNGFIKTHDKISNEQMFKLPLIQYKLKKSKNKLFLKLKMNAKIDETLPNLDNSIKPSIRKL